MPNESHDQIVKRAAKQLLGLAGVTAVGLGNRERDGEQTEERVIKVYVVKKRPAFEVPRAEMVPREIEGIPTDVVEVGNREHD